MKTQAIILTAAILCLTAPGRAVELIDDPEAPWVQSLDLGGYLHFQSAAVDGETGGREFWYDRGSDWRRGRLTAKATVLRAVDLSLQANAIRDNGATGGGVEFGYDSIFHASAELDLTRLTTVPGFDRLSVAYGKRKLTELAEDLDSSINSILTVERSALTGQIAPFRLGTGTTGGWIIADRGNHRFTAGVYTTDSSPEFGDWNDGMVLVGSWSHDFAERCGLDTALVSLGGGLQEVDGRDETYAPWKWIFTPWIRLENGRRGLRVGAAIGENEGPGASTGGWFHGLSVMPTWWLVDQRLRAVMRYTVSGAEAPRGLQMNSRYAREAGLAANEAIPALAAGRGDFHHSLYAGLVWHPVPGQVSVLTGIEWEKLESRDATIYEGLTGWFATRLVF